METQKCDETESNTGLKKNFEGVGLNRFVFPRLYLVFILIMVFFVFSSASVLNPGIYELSDQATSYMNEAFNAAVILTIPFFLGVVGSIIRILLSGYSVTMHSMVVVASGLMGALSWIGIKSGILFYILVPHIERPGHSLSDASIDAADFYSMAFVSILVGMFSSNIYMLVNKKVESFGHRNQGESNQSGKADA